MSSRDWCLTCNGPWDDLCGDHRGDCNYVYDLVDEGGVEKLNKNPYPTARDALGIMTEMVANTDEQRLHKVQYNTETVSLGSFGEVTVLKLELFFNDQVEKEVKTEAGEVNYQTLAN